MSEILIAIGFFCIGGFMGTALCLHKLTKIQKEKRHKHIIVYEF